MHNNAEHPTIDVWDIGDCPQDPEEVRQTTDLARRKAEDIAKKRSSFATAVLELMHPVKKSSYKIQFSSQILMY